MVRVASGHLSRESGEIHSNIAAFFRQRRSGALQQLMELFTIHVDEFDGRFHRNSASRSRKSELNGYPKTCLIERFGT